jgi:general secretion pathway protein D
MNSIISKLIRGSAALIAIIVLLIPAAIHAQQRGGTGGGGFGGGFGGGGGGAARTGSSSSSSATSSRDYPNNTLPGDATFSYDPETHSLIVMTDDSTFSNISQVVSNLDQPKPQVLIKVVFLEVTHNDSLDFGVEGSYNHSFNPSTGITNLNLQNAFGINNTLSSGQTIGQVTTPPGAGLYSVLGKDFTATVRAISSASKVEVLSRPSILVRNNQPATITIGQSVPLVTGVTYPSTVSGPVSTITYQNVGIILQVTPFISRDGLVEMIVAPQISSLSSQKVNISSNFDVPVIELRSANTVVVTPDGQTVIIGGLIETDKTLVDSKIPILGDIPWLGNLFKHKQHADTKKELLIFLTPYVVNQPSRLASLTGAINENGRYSNSAFKDSELDKFFDRLPRNTNSNWKADNVKK